MRPINLLPANQRPSAPSGGRQGSSYFVVGALAAVFLAALLYVLTTNSITSRTDEVTRAKNEAQEAEARAATLAPYGAFSEIKRAREEAVKQLARGRFDWERMTRELARVLPRSVWITQLEASANPGAASGAPSASGSASSSSSGSSSGSSTASTSASTPPAGAGSGPAGPSLTLQGCTHAQPEVATMLVRLRRLHRVEEVKLVESKQDEVEAGGAAAPAAPGTPAGGGTAGADDGCGTTRGVPNFVFKLVVTFTPGPVTPATEGRGVPASLGGGS